MEWLVLIKDDVTDQLYARTSNCLSGQLYVSSFIISITFASKKKRSLNISFRYNFSLSQQWKFVLKLSPSVS